MDAILQRVGIKDEDDGDIPFKPYHRAELVKAKEEADKEFWDLAGGVASNYNNIIKLSTEKYISLVSYVISKRAKNVGQNNS
jgi:hypothetical protein